MTRIEFYSHLLRELQMNIIKSTLLVASAGIAIAGCSSAPVKQADVPVAATAPVAVKSTMAAPVTAVAALPAYLDPNSLISKERSVYFGFNDYSIKADYNTLIERQGKYLASMPTLAIKIEGNADERGGAEYNLALGQKRADAVLRALKAIGVKDTQMEATSWGKEKPKAMGHDETAYAQNRRADLVYPQK